MLLVLVAIGLWVINNFSDPLLYSTIDVSRSLLVSVAVSIIL